MPVEASWVTGADQLSALKLVSSQLDSNQLFVFLDAEDLHLMEGDTCTSEIVQKFESWEVSKSSFLVSGFNQYIT